MRITFACDNIVPFMNEILDNFRSRAPILRMVEALLNEARGIDSGRGWASQ